MTDSVFGILRVYPDEKNPLTYSTFTLKKGENLIGSSRSCDIQLDYPHIGDQHCKIIISENSDYSIEDLGSKHGIYRVAGDQSHQKLKPNKEYELVSKKPFFIANKYKCVFQAVVPIADNDEDGEEDFQKPQSKVNNGKEAEPTQIILDDESPVEIGNMEQEEESREEEREVKRNSSQVKEEKKVGKSNRLPVSDNESDMEISVTIIEDDKGKSTGRPKDVMKTKALDKEKDSEELAPRQGFVKNFKSKNRNIVQKTSEIAVKPMRKNTVEEKGKRIELRRKKSDLDEEGSQKEDEEEEGGKEEKEEEVDEEEEEIDESEKLGRKIAKKSDPRKRNQEEDTKKKQKKETGKEKGNKSKKGQRDQNEKENTKKAKQVLGESNKDGTLKAAETRTNPKRGGDENNLRKLEKELTTAKKVKTEGAKKSPIQMKILIGTPSKVSSGKEVYSISSRSSPEISVIENPKRSESKKGVKNSQMDKSIERIFSKRNPYKVMFSGFDGESQQTKYVQKKLIELGAKIVEDKKKDFTVLVMNKFKRTIKFLLAISKGVHIVNGDWVKNSIKEGKLIAPEDYAYVDKAAEAKYKFKLANSLEKARTIKEGLLEGYRVYATPNIKPSNEEINLLVESLGGIPVKTKPTMYQEDLLIILDENDGKNANYFRGIGFTPYTSELIFSAILQQKLDLDSNMI